ncbi:MAG: amidohydrolase family protein, partial [Chloroflexi bacterium]|nr:amidohydrolase family protein [Chloroflexota bacterium]
QRALQEARRQGHGHLSRAGRQARLTSKPLLDPLLLVAAEWASERAVPLQLHSGVGDRDLDLRLANPMHLRPALEDGPLARAPVVLLHASYPYTREASYLAAVYPNVYVDLSEATPLLTGPTLARLMEELLALAPVTKVLYGSDAWGVPEWFWLAARAARRALAVATAWLPADEAAWLARRVLAENARELYRLGV